MSLTAAQKENVRNLLALFCDGAERARLNWTYVEQRPFHGFGESPAAAHVADCSAYVSLCFNWAMHESGIYLADPLGEHYSGYGYTGTELAFFLRYGEQVPHGNPVLVGDCAIFGTASNTIHTAICKLRSGAGGPDTAILSSNGHGTHVFASDAPAPIMLGTAAGLQPLVGVYRHPALL